MEELKKVIEREYELQEGPLKLILNKMKNAIPFYNLFDLGGVSFSV